MSRREQTKAATHRALADAAVELVLTGDGATTMGAIADAAGVSRRTAYRYATDQAELLFFHPISWLEVFDRAIAEVEDRPIDERLRVASLAIAAHIESDPIPVKRAFQAATSDPAFAGSGAAVNVRWVDRVTAEIVGVGAPVEVELRGRMLGAAIMGMIDTVCLHWAVSDEPMTPLIHEGFDLLAGAFRWLD